jgi:hypothetical protein
MTGSVGILNVGAGDTKLVFDNFDPGEVARASRIVKDMIRRGFALFIQIGTNERGPIYQRAHDFDEATAEYIVAGSPGETEVMNDEEPASAPRGRRKTKASVRIPASTASAVAVARTAGG